MTITSMYPIVEEGLEEALCSKLRQFRLGLEGQSGESVSAMEAPIALLLSDLCVFTGLNEEQHRRVLGDEGVAFVNDVLATRMRLKMNGRVGTARQ